jgi:two-component system chemotaxis response regulator CheY
MPNSNARILVVDDELHTRRMICRILRQVGFDNLDENDGTTVFQALKANKLDLVICDWWMTPAPGIEVLQFVRADPDLKDLPFIMLTGENTSEAVVAAMHAGVDGYVTKPCSMQTLRTKVERALSIK